MGYLQNLETALVLLPVGEMLWDAISSLYLFLLELFLPLSQVADAENNNFASFPSTKAEFSWHRVHVDLDSYAT